MAYTEWQSGWTAQYQPPEPPAAFDPRAAKPLVLGVIASAVAACVLSWCATLFGAPLAIDVALFYLVLFGGMVWVSQSLSRQYGTGNMVTDFEWRVRPADIGLGILVFVGAYAAFTVAFLPWVDVEEPTSGSAGGDINSAVVVVFIAACVVGAPLVEELVFRGVLQRALVPGHGATLAVFIQAALFGVYHFLPAYGWYNLAVVTPRIAAGVVIGLGAKRWRRLGPGIVAHAINNGVFILAVMVAVD